MKKEATGDIRLSPAYLLGMVFTLEGRPKQR
jgi:hypothetical protein